MMMGKRRIVTYCPKGLLLCHYTCYSITNAVYSARMFSRCLRPSDILYACCLALSLLLFGLFCYAAFSDYFWGDEAVSLQFVSRSYADLSRIVLVETHPPLYYFLLKLLTDGGQFVLGGDVTLLHLSKFVSLLPWALLLLLCVTYIRRKYGRFVSAFCALQLFAAPSFFTYALEIRMYSWALLFVTLAFLACEELLERPKSRAWVVFTLTSAAAAYTQYFAGVAVGILYGYLVLAAIRCRELRMPLACSALACFMLYAPWLPVVLKQVQDVAEDFWIPEITLGVLKGVCCFAAGSMKRLMLIAGIAGLGFVASVAVHRGGGGRILRALALPVLLVVAGCLLSWMMRPIFVSRYMFPTLFCLWLGVAQALSSMQRGVVVRCVAYGLALLLTGVNLRSLDGEWDGERKRHGAYKELVQMLEQNQDARWLCAPGVGGCGIITYWTGKPTYLMQRVRPDGWLAKGFGDLIVSTPTPEAVCALLHSDDRPLYLLAQAPPEGVQEHSSADELAEGAGLRLHLERRMFIGLGNVCIYRVTAP